MPCSQNVAFAGTIAPDPDFDDPPGASIARELRSRLKALGWDVSEIENWRDCGWQVDCWKDEVALQAVLAPSGESSAWMLQIAPLRAPGFIMRFFGTHPSATPDDVYSLAQAVHSILTQQGAFSNFRWRWDGFPDEKSSTSEPTPPTRTGRS